MSAPLPPLPPCPNCQGTEDVTQHDTSEFPHVHSYQCQKCQYYWITTLAGTLLISGFTTPPSGGHV